MKRPTNIHLTSTITGLLWTACAFLLTTCTRSTNDQQAFDQAITIKYAKGFTVQASGNGFLVNVRRPYQGAASGYTYLLVPRGTTVPPHDADVQVIETPIESIVCTSTTHIPHLDYIGESEKLVGFPSTDYVSSEIMRKRIDAGKVTDLGIDKGMNLEVLFSLNPSMVMGYTMSADLGQLAKIRELGIPVVINAEYLESNPLGRAEWIKFTSLFFNKQAEADSVFNSIETEYLNTRSLVKDVTYKPGVLSGTVYGDAWFMPGGQNYASQILTDAGAHYMWASDSTTGWLELSFEAVYDHAKDADIWIVGSFNSLTELENADNRYTLFKPFKEQHVFSYGARMGSKGGNDFLESGYVRPDIILKDLVKLAHPDLLPDHELYYHKRLTP